MTETKVKMGTCVKCKACSEIREQREAICRPLGLRPLMMGKCPICGSALFHLEKRGG